MVKRLIVYSQPLGAINQARVYRTITEQDNPSPYETIDFLLENMESLENLKNEQVSSPRLITEIMTIHNATGMRDISQLKTMIEKVERGDHVYNDNGLPNVKVCLAPNGKLLMFDGHHTALAYLLAGRKYLHQLPYIEISNQNQPLTSQEISYFFPEDYHSRVESDWQDYTVNWQSPKDKAEKRVQQTLGDLLEIIKQ